MAEDGIVGEYNGSKAREVVMTMAQWQAMQGLDAEEEDEVPKRDAAAAYGQTEELTADENAQSEYKEAEADDDEEEADDDEEDDEADDDEADEEADEEEDGDEEDGDEEYEDYE